MGVFEKILFFVDGDAPEAVAVEKAVERAGVLGASLTFAGVVPGKQKLRLLSMGGPSADELQAFSIETETTKLDSLVAGYRDRGVEISTRVLVGKPATAVAEAVLKDGFQMVWKSPARGGTPGQRLLGSLDMRVIRSCPCPVIVVDHRERNESQTVFVAALDVATSPDDQASNDQLNRHILELASNVLTGPNYKLHVVHAWELYGESILKSSRFKMSSEELSELLESERAARLRKVEELIAEFRAELSPADAALFSPEIHLIKGAPNQVIPDAIKELKADILLMGTVSRSGLSGLLLGNTAEEVLYGVDCSVAIVKPDGFICPVEASPTR